MTSTVYAAFRDAAHAWHDRPFLQYRIVDQSGATIADGTPGALLLRAAGAAIVLRQHRLVREVACVAVPDDLRDEEVLACIIPREPVCDTAREAADIMAGELGYFKASGYVALVDALPLAATNKIQRGAFKAWGCERPGTPGCIDTRRLEQRRCASA